MAAKFRQKVELPKSRTPCLLATSRRANTPPPPQKKIPHRSNAYKPTNPGSAKHTNRTDRMPSDQSNRMTQKEKKRKKIEDENARGGEGSVEKTVTGGAARRAGCGCPGNMGGCCATCCMSNACCKSCCCMPATTARPRLLGFGRGTNHRPRPDDGTEEKNRKEKKEKKMKKKVSPRSRRRRIFSFYSIVLDFSETIATATDGPDAVYQT
jgi:hypothetical protein